MRISRQLACGQSLSKDSGDSSVSANVWLPCGTYKSSSAASIVIVVADRFRLTQLRTRRCCCSIKFEAAAMQPPPSSWRGFRLVPSSLSPAAKSSCGHKWSASPASSAASVAIGLANLSATGRLLALSAHSAHSPVRRAEEEIKTRADEIKKN